jgi:Uma2 family endonuclease
MAQVAPTENRYTTEAYFDLVAAGIMRPDDRVELLEGVIVAMSPHNPRHASATRRVSNALNDAIGRRAVISVQLPLIVGAHSVPEPDVAVIPGQASDYDDAHPTTAMLVVEVADSSLIQDRLTKVAMYAGAGIPEYWLVNLRDYCVEVFRLPDPATRRYSEKRLAYRGDRLDMVAIANTSVAVADILPEKR